MSAQRSSADTDVHFVAGDITFERHARKARANVRKHGVSFEEAATVFVDPLARIFADPDHSTHEDRFIIVGVSVVPRALLVVHAERGDRVRIIGARLAGRHERAMMLRE